MSAANPIRVLPGQFADSLALIRSSALDGCTLVDGDDAGPFIARRWPVFSSGEELLWRVLAWLNGSSDLPSDADLRERLDDTNLAAARSAAAAGSGVTA